MRYSRCVAFIVVVWALFAPNSVRAAEGDKEIAKILGDWQRRHHQFKTVRYTISGTVEFKDEKLPAGDPVRPTQAVILLDLERHRYRCENQVCSILWKATNVPKKYVDYKEIETFDGKEWRGLSEQTDDVRSGFDLGIVKGELVHQRMLVEAQPLFFAHGVVSTVWNALKPNQWPTTFDRENFQYLGEQSFQSRKCAAVRTAPVAYSHTAHDEFWIDTGRDSAILRYVYFVGSSPDIRIDVEWQERAGTTVPNKWSFTWTIGKGFRVARYKVDSLEANPAVSDNDFTIPAKPGMKVQVQEMPSAASGLDPGYPAERTYVITPSGVWEEVSARGARTLGGQVLSPPPEHRRRWLWWCAGALASALAGLGFALVVRRHLRIQRDRGS